MPQPVAIDRVTLPLFAYLRSRCIGEVTGISFIDSTPLRVCSTKRVSRHRAFDGLAAHTQQPKKPSLNLTPDEQEGLLVLP